METLLNFLKEKRQEEGDFPTINSAVEPSERSLLGLELAARDFTRERGHILQRYRKHGLMRTSATKDRSEPFIHRSNLIWRVIRPPGLAW
jgi:hypothetical protein